jgi:DNA-binding Xre family transcriptional regulator
MNENYIGSQFDDFLAEEGILQETEQAAIKRVLAMQLMELMTAQKINKTEMAKRMKTSRSSLDRLLDPENESVTLVTIEKAAEVLGKRLHLSIA